MIVPSILSGGFGSRLWPLSRRALPKQFHKLFGNRSLFQLTCERVSGEMFAPPLIICNQQHRFVAAEQLAEENIKPETIILEPFGRNTAASAALASIVASQNDPDSLVLLLPSDHLISNPELLISTLSLASNAAKNGSIVTFGISPDTPHTGYGYLKLADLGAPIRKVEKFIEKPDKKTAESFLASENYFWNSGIFLFSATHMVEIFENTEPEILNGAKMALEKSERDSDFLRLEPEAFAEIPNISFDYAIMEKSSDIVCVKTDLDWSDLGSWSSVWKSLNRDENENSHIGEQHVFDGSRNLTVSNHAPVFLLGLNDLVVINTKDALLVADKNREQEIKKIVDFLDSSNRPETSAIYRQSKSWGWKEQISNENDFLVNLLTVNPAKLLSGQNDKINSRHWIVKNGRLDATVGDEIIQLGPNQSVFVPSGVVYKLINTGKTPARIIEIEGFSNPNNEDVQVEKLQIG